MVSACCSIPPPDWTITPTPHGSATMAMATFAGRQRRAGASWKRWQQRGSEARITELSEIFTTATRLEAQFRDTNAAAGDLGRDGAVRGPWPEPACRRPSAVRQPVVYGPRRAGCQRSAPAAPANQPAAGNGRSGARHPREKWSPAMGNRFRAVWRGWGQKDLLYPLAERSGQRRPRRAAAR